MAESGLGLGREAEGVLLRTRDHAARRPGTGLVVGVLLGLTGVDAVEKTAKSRATANNQVFLRAKEWQANF
jgi:hypothetical protein